MTLARLPLLAAVAAAALAVPAAADAHAGGRHAAADHAAHGHAGKGHGTHGHGKGATQLAKGRRIVLRGTWAAGSVDVTGGNRAARRAGLVGQSVAVDLGDARLRVRDVDGDGARDESDLRDGDRVVVQGRGAADGSLDVHALVDRARGDAAGQQGDSADDAGDPSADDSADPSA